jgi:hypothetical protein
MSDARFTDCLVRFLMSMMNLTLNFVGILNYMHHIYDHFTFLKLCNIAEFPILDMKPLDTKSILYRDMIFILELIKSLFYPWQ